MNTNKKIFLEARNLAFKLLYQAKLNKQEVNLSPENMDILIETLTIPDDETDQKSFNHDTIELSKYILNICNRLQNSIIKNARNEIINLYR